MRAKFNLLIFLALYNSWIIGILLNWNLTRHGATISELAANPTSGLFYRACDFLAGLVLVIFAQQFAHNILHKRTRQIVLAAFYIIGLVSMFDAFIPLDCLPSVDTICAQKEQLGQVSWRHSVHIYESVILTAIFAAAPIALWLKDKRPQVKRTSFWLGIFLAYWAIDSVIRASNHMQGYGYPQRIYMLIFAYWLSLVVLAKNPKPSQGSSR